MGRASDRLGGIEDLELVDLAGECVAGGLDLRTESLERLEQRDDVAQAAICGTLDRRAWTATRVRAAPDTAVRVSDRAVR